MTKDEVLKLVVSVCDPNTVSPIEKDGLFVVVTQDELLAFANAIEKRWREKWQSIETAPWNERIIVLGEHRNGYDESALAWHEEIDGNWYYAPQGGIVDWEIKWWIPVAPDAIRENKE